MAIVRWNDPYSLWRRSFGPAFDWDDMPEVHINTGLDMFETEGAIIIKAAVPGIPADKVTITFEDSVLRIQAKFEETEEEKKQKKIVHRQEKIATFDYTTTLPRAIETDKISASVSNGVVTVTAPIAKEARPRKISVQAA